MSRNDPLYTDMGELVIRRQGEYAVIRLLGGDDQTGPNVAILSLESSVSHGKIDHIVPSYMIIDGLGDKDKEEYELLQGFG